MASGDTLVVLTPLGSEAPASSFATLGTRNAHPVLDFDAASTESAVGRQFCQGIIQVAALPFTCTGLRQLRPAAMWYGSHRLNTSATAHWTLILTGLRPQLPGARPQHQALAESLQFQTKRTQMARS
jgi:hypothetical protein